MCAFHVFHKTQETLETAFLEGWNGQGYLYPVPLANRGVGNVRFYLGIGTSMFNMKFDDCFSWNSSIFSKKADIHYIEYSQSMLIRGSSQLDENIGWALWHRAAKEQG